MPGTSVQCCHVVVIALDFGHKMLSLCETNPGNYRIPCEDKKEESNADTFLEQRMIATIGI